MKQISAALVLCNEEKLLGCIPNGKPMSFDLPKGHIEPGEKPRDAVVRETFEETGLDISDMPLVDLGKMPYITEKDLWIFVLKVKKLPSIFRMRCTSYFKDPYTGREKPEVIGYDYSSWGDLSKFFKPLQPILLEIRKYIRKE